MLSSWGTACQAVGEAAAKQGESFTCVCEYRRRCQLSDHTPLDRLAVELIEVRRLPECDRACRLAAPQGHNYRGHHYIGHNYIGHNYMGITTYAMTCPRAIVRAVSPRHRHRAGNSVDDSQPNAANLVYMAWRVPGVAWRVTPAYGLRGASVYCLAGS